MMPSQAYDPVNCQASQPSATRWVQVPINDNTLPQV
jgi:hypothetical protein